MSEVSRITDKRDTAQRNTTADRAIDVLLLFDQEHPMITATEVAQRLEMPRSTTYRYLKSLRDAGLVEGDPAGGFRLGARILQLASIARRGLDVSELALPRMRQLADEVGEAVLLTKRFGNQVICVERQESAHPIRLSYERGQVLPIHAGAAAKVLLGWETPGEIERVLANATLPRFTDETHTDKDRLLADLEKIREEGYAVSRGEIDTDVLGVAAPIRSAEGAVIAGLSVAALAFRVSADGEKAIVTAVVRAAEDVSSRLGFGGERPGPALSDKRR